MSTPLQKMPLLVRTLIFGDGALRVATSMSMPFLAIFLGRTSTLPLWAVGLVVGLAPLAQIFGGFFAGQASDRLGRVPLFLGSVLGLALLSLGFYWASQLPDGGTKFTSFALLNLAFGLLMSVSFTLTQAILSDLVEPALRPRAYHQRYTMVNVGSAIGPALGARLGFSTSGHAFLLTALFYLLFAGLFVCILKRAPQGKLAPTGPRPSLRESFTTLLEDRKLRYFILAGMIFTLCYCQLESTLSQHLVKRFEDGVTLFADLITLNCVTVVAIQTFSYPIIRRVGFSRSLFGGSLTLALGFVIMAVAGQEPWLYALAMFVATVGEVFVFGPSSAFMDQLAPEHLRGTYFGVANFKRLGASIGPVLGGFLLETTGGPGLFLIIALLAVVSAGIQLVGEQIPFHRHRVAA